MGRGEIEIGAVDEHAALTAMFAACASKTISDRALFFFDAADHTPMKPPPPVVMLVRQNGHDLMRRTALDLAGGQAYVLVPVN